MSLDNQSLCLRDLGRRKDALPANDLATATCRELAASQPDTVMRDLAHYLYRRCNLLAELGRQEDAQAAIEQAVAIRRQLAQERPDAFLPDLAAALSNQSRRNFAGG